MVRLNKIYTRTGDDGTTGLVDGSRIAKDDARMAAIGAVDEANCAIGHALVAFTAAVQGDAIGIALKRIQNDLFDLGADLATPGDDFTPGEMQLRMTEAQSSWLEECIDAANEALEPLKSFILPGGTEAAARVHIARASVRSAERMVVTLASESSVNPAALTYINRLSDYLFVAARSLNDCGRADILWVPGANRA